MKRLSFNIDGENVKVWAEKLKGVLWVHYNGKTFTYEPPSKSKKKKGSKASGEPGEILAPMPGKIIKVNAKAGDTVEANSTLVVMEAMKMEYSLKSDIKGLVGVFKCKEGEQVALGDLLVKVVPSDES